MGLTAATLLRDAGYTVHIYAAGVAVDHLGCRGRPILSVVRRTPANCQCHCRNSKSILRTSFAMHSATGSDSGYGGSRDAVNYSKHGSGHQLRQGARRCHSARRRSTHACRSRSFNQPGYGYQDPARRATDLPQHAARPELSADVRFSSARSTPPRRSRSPPELVVMNCAGLGAGPLFSDPKVEPIKGQLVLVKIRNPRSTSSTARARRMYSGPRTTSWSAEATKLDPDDDRVDESSPSRRFCGWPGHVRRRHLGPMSRAVDAALVGLDLGGDSGLSHRGLCHRTADAAERRGTVRGPRRVRGGTVRRRGPGEYPARTFRTVVNSSDLESGYAADG